VGGGSSTHATAVQAEVLGLTVAAEMPPLDQSHKLARLINNTGRAGRCSLTRFGWQGTKVHAVLGMTKNCLHNQ
jgi:hypothetical protein